MNINNRPSRSSV